MFRVAEVCGSTKGGAFTIKVRAEQYPWLKSDKIWCIDLRILYIIYMYITYDIFQGFQSEVTSPVRTIEILKNPQLWCDPC